jgi:adenylosuccinate synthase
MEGIDVSTVYIVAGLLYGDEGKGTTVEYLVKKTNAELVVRYNGGPQAAHHVVLEDRKTSHCFSQFGSGSFFSYSHTLLSKYMFVSPHTMLREAKKLIEVHGIKDIMSRMHIDYRCFIITPFHQMINRISEILRGSKKHGSTGLGVGVCVEEAFFAHPEKFPLGKELFDIDSKNTWRTYNTLQAKDLLNEKFLKIKLSCIINEKIEQAKELIRNFSENKSSQYTEDENNILKIANNTLYDFIGNHNLDSLLNFYTEFARTYKNCFCNGIDLIKENLSNNKNIIFEGAQGCLLDKIYGIYPHLTKTLCSDVNAQALLNEILRMNINFSRKKIGVLRCYSSRHGNGPFITHRPEYDDCLKEKHNVKSQWQGDFKVGPFDLVGAKYGIEIFKPDFLSITCLDRIFSIINEENFTVPICTQYLVSKQDIEILDEDLFNFESDEYIHKIKDIKRRQVFKAYKNSDFLNTLNKSSAYIEKISLKDSANQSNQRECPFYIKIAENLLQNDFYQKVLGNNQINMVANFLNYLKNLLNIDIGLISLGPTHNDKIAIGKLF